MVPTRTPQSKITVWTIAILLTALIPALLPAQQSPGLTLIAPGGLTSASLVDTNGTVAHTWSNLSGQTAYSSYLMPGGFLLRTVRASGNSFNGGGLSGQIQKHTYDGDLVWDFTYSTQEYCSHHDICPLPNGNVLIIAYVRKTASEASAAGASNSIEIWSEKIVEVKQTGLTTGEIVWEWHAWDHLVQNIDPNKSNYHSSIVDHPELLNINYLLQKDWLHMNGVDYNPTLDQIVMSTHNLNEVYVIDHSTTTAEAASHAGGVSGRGGDILYRWGNPAAYQAEGSKIFNVVHDGHFVPYGYVHAGRIGAFNNKGVSVRQSSVDMIEPPYRGYSYDREAGKAFEPATYTERYECNGYTSNEGSGVQLRNGNTLYCIALSGKVYEIDTTGTTLWTYSTGGKTAQAHRYEECYITSPISILATASQRSVCGNTPVTLGVELYGVPTATYSWRSDPAGFSSTDQSPTVTPTTSTTYVVTATEPGGCTTISTILIEVRDMPGPLSISGPTTVKQASETTYFVPSVSGSTYAWTVDGGTITTGQGTPTINVMWGSEPTGRVSVEETPTAGCAGSEGEVSIVISSDELTVSPLALTFTELGGDTTLTITSSGEWTSSSPVQWLVLTPVSGSTSGTMTVTAAPNTESTSRIVNITITSGPATVRVAVTQAAAAPDNVRPVTFLVDMRNAVINATGVHVAGDFQEEAGFPLGDWQPHTTEMLNIPGTSIYGTTVVIPMNKKWEYKFVNGDQFYESEFVAEESRIGHDFNDNRWFYLDDATTDTLVVGPILLGENAGFGQKMIRVAVNMEKQSSVDPNGAYVITPTGSTPMYAFQPKVYEAQIYFPSNTEVNYVFANGRSTNGREIPAADCAPNGYRTVDTDTHAVVATVCFAACVDCSVTSVYEGGQGARQDNPLAHYDGQFQATVSTLTGATIRSFQTTTSLVDQELDGLAAGVYLVTLYNANTQEFHRYTILKD